MITTDVPLPCSADPQGWDLPTLVTSLDEAHEALYRAQKAARICRTECPVRDACLDQAHQRRPQLAVQGGWLWSRNHEPVSLSAWRPVVRDYPECGTSDGYRRHLADGQNPCGPCRASAPKAGAA